MVASYKLTFGASAIAATLNAVFGLVVAWVLVRYSFPGRNVVDAMVDLPFAMPTAVSGIALTAVYAPQGWIGRWLEPLGIKVAYTPLGVMVALTFIGLPFVVRTLQPALEDMDMEIEESAASLGATRLQTFVRVIFPTILPALLTGFALAFARAGRIRLRDLHFRQPAHENGDHAAADRHEVGTIQLSRGGGHRRGHADGVVPGVVVHQFVAVVEQAVRRLIGKRAVILSAAKDLAGNWRFFAARQNDCRMNRTRFCFASAWLTRIWGYVGSGRYHSSDHCRRGEPPRRPPSRAGCAGC